MADTDKDIIIKDIRFRCAWGWISSCYMERSEQATLRDNITKCTGMDVQTKT